MRKIRIRIRLKVYPVLWTIIILLSVYILIRFAAISFSKDMGQASFKEALESKFCNLMIEAGACLISYSAKEENAYAFPISVAENGIPLEKFVEDTVTFPVDQQERYILDYYDDTASETVVEAGEELVFPAEVEESGEDINIYEINQDKVSMEYLLTNGEVLQSLTTGILLGDETLIDGQLQIGYLEGNISQKDIRVEMEEDEETVEAATSNDAFDFTLDDLQDISFLVRNFYTVDASTRVSETLFDAEELLNKDMKLKQGNEAPQILIYHTHSQEAYTDSRPGKSEDTVVGVGEYLTKILQEEYGYNVIHDTTTYDILDKEKLSKVAYSEALDGLSKILEENPTIEVMIDLHRNSGDAKTTVIDGKETAQIMLFNGLCRDQNGPMTSLDNPYLQDNLAFSFQMQLKSKDSYPGLFIKNYLKSFRFNMHLRPKSMLVELGTWKNTLESARNAIGPFAEILDDILKGE